MPTGLYDNREHQKASDKFDYYYQMCVRERNRPRDSSFSVLADLFAPMTGSEKDCAIDERKPTMCALVNTSKSGLFPQKEEKRPYFFFTKTTWQTSK